MHHSKERNETAFDSKRAWSVALWRLGSGRVIPVDGAMHRDLGVLDVDVSPFERLELSCSEPEVERERHEPAPTQRHRIGVDQLRELRRVKEALRLVRPSIWTFNIGTRLSGRTRSDTFFDRKASLNIFVVTAHVLTAVFHDKAPVRTSPSRCCTSASMLSRCTWIMGWRPMHGST
jgi:hypothetical protein